MKNFIIGFCSVIILILSGLTINTIHGENIRENELSSTLSTAMEQSMRILTLDKKYQMDNEKEFIADFIQNAMITMNSESEYDITIHTVDIDKGILDVSVVERYKQVFIPGKVTARKTIILEDIHNANKPVLVTFKKGDAVIKQISMTTGDFMSAGSLPQNVGVTSWVLEQNGVTYTKDNIANVSVTQNLVFKAK